MKRFVAICLLFASCSSPHVEYPARISRPLCCVDLSQPAGYLELERPEVKLLPTSSITRHQAIEISLSNHRPLRAAFEHLGVAHADLFQAGLLTNPTFELAWRFPPAGSDIEGAALFALNDLWQLPARRRVAATDLQIELLDLADRILETSFETQVCYDSQLLALTELQLAQEMAKESAAYESMILYRQQFGLNTDLDLSMAQVATGRQWLDSLSKERRAKTAMQKLRYQLGLVDYCCCLELADPLLPPCWNLPPLEELICAALQCNPALHAQRLRVRKACERVKLERKRILRQVDLGIGYVEEPGIGSGFGPAISLEVPLFDQNQAQISRACALWREESDRFEAKRQWLVTEVSENYERFLSAQKQINLFVNQVLPGLEGGLAYTEEYSQTHQIPHLLLIDAKRTLVEGKMIYWELLYQARVARAELERLVGANTGQFD